MANQIPIILSAGRQRQIPNADNLVVFGVVVGTGTITANRPCLDLSQTWNNAAIDFTAIKLNVVNSNSGSFSLLVDLQVGGISQFAVTPAGDVSSNIFYAAQAIDTPKIQNLTTNGLIKTINNDGTLDIETRIRKGYFWYGRCV